MMVVSDSDLWSFVSSTGALTAGRVDADHALLPYETVDKLHRAVGSTGPVTAIARTLDGRRELWRPFGAELTASCARSIAKSVLGDRPIFEEHHDGWGPRVPGHLGAIECPRLGPNRRGRRRCDPVPCVGESGRTLRPRDRDRLLAATSKWPHRGRHRQGDPVPCAGEPGRTLRSHHRDRLLAATREWPHRGRHRRYDLARGAGQPAWTLRPHD